RSLHKNYLTLKQEILNHPDIQEFLVRYPQLTNSEIEKKLNKLYEYTRQAKTCTSIDTCPNILQGYRPHLYVKHNEIHLTYRKSAALRDYESQQKQHQLMKSLYIPHDILKATIEHIEVTHKRHEAIHHTNQFLKQAEQGIPSRGIYFYGPFGSGKTYFLGAIANQLKQLNVS